MFSTWKLDHSSARHRLLLRIGLSLFAIALLGLTAAAQDYDVTILTSDIPDVGINDTNLVNPWGLVASPTSPWWVSDNGMGLSTLYDADGNPQSLVVSVPQWDNTPGGNPTGIVFNGTSDFKINGNATHFLFATEDGTIQGWTGGTSTIIAVNKFGDGAVYKGLALGSAGGANYIYAANFHNGTVDVFDATFMPHSFGNGAFQDHQIPDGFAPFNAANIGGNIVVTYAKQNAEKHDDVRGPGNGYVDVYDSQGNLLSRLKHTAFMNSPWAVVKAPADFGVFSNRLLVGQFGSGAIQAFDDHGHLSGLLFDAALLPMRIESLWGLSFGNGHTAGPTNVLYFTAGTFEEAHGTFGRISVAECHAPFCRRSQPQTHKLTRHKK